MEIRNFIRAWLAFTVLQLFGNLWQCLQSKKFTTILSHKEATADTKAIAGLFTLHYMTMLILRLFVIYYFDCIPLQIFHIIFTLLSTIFFIVEVFYVEILDKSAALYSQIALSGGTVLLILITWKWIFAVTVKSEKRRKLTALQMMENDYSKILKKQS